MLNGKRAFGLAIAVLMLASSIAIVAPPAKAAANAWVEGYVHVFGTSTPIANASVVLEYGIDDQNDTLTNATGYFRVGANTPYSRVYDLTVFHQGYYQNRTTVTLDIWVNVTQDVDLATAPPRDCAIYGRVRDGLSGANVSGQSVVALSGTYVNGTTTGPGGGYLMRLLGYESYTIVVDRPGYEYVRKYVEPVPGQNLSLDFWLEPNNSTVRGVVRDTLGLPVTSAYVTVSKPRERANIGDDVSYEQSVDASGRFIFNVSRGVWKVLVQDSNNGHYINALSVIAANGKVTWQNFTLASLPVSTATVSGYIEYYSNGTPAAGAHMSCGNVNGTWANNSLADGAGFYTMEVIPGEINFSPTADGFVSNLTTLSIVAGGSYWLNGTIASTFVNSSIDGYVMNASIPVEGAHVRATYGGWNAEAWTDNLGHYSLLTIGAPIDVRFMANGMATSVAHIVVPENSAMYLNQTLSPLDGSGELRGIVKDNFDVPIEKATVYLGDEGSWGTGVYSDYAGLYQRGVPTSNTSYMMFASGYEYASGSCAPMADQVTWVNATLKRVSLTSTLRIRLVAPRWGFVERAHITLTATDKQWWLDAETDKYGEAVVAVPPGKVLLSFDAWSNGFVDTGQMAWSVAPSKTRWLNITLFPRDLKSYVQGRVQNSTDGISGAFVFLRFGDTYYNDVTGLLGQYNITVPDSVAYEGTVSANGYRTVASKRGVIAPWLGDEVDVTLQDAPAWFIGLTQVWFRDTDAIPDGKYDVVQVNVTVDVASAGKYRVSAELAPSRMSGSDIVCRASNTTQLSAGAHNVSLVFQGYEIYNSRKDGYFLTVHLREDGSAAELDWIEQYTAPHKWTDFDAPTALIETPFQRWLVDSDFDGLYNMLVVNITIDNSIAGNFTLIGSLNDIMIKSIDQAIAYSYLAVGHTNLQLQFSGTAIRRNSRNIGLVTLGLYEQVPNDQTGGNPVHDSYFYAPYDYRIFQQYPSTANISGTVRDATNAPIDGITVIAYNVTHRYLNTVVTNATGKYTVGCFPGDWIVAIDDSKPYGPSSKSRYQGNLTVLKGVTLGANVTHNVKLADSVPNSQWGRISFSSWNETRVESMMSIVTDNQTFRFMMDVYNVGDGDGYLSDEESTKLLSMIGQLNLDNDSRDMFRVDGVNYTKNATSEELDLGITGYVWSKESAFMHMSANFKSPVIMAGASHVLSLNGSYDGTSSDGGDNSTYIYYAALPKNFARTGNDAVPNITVSGTDYVTIDPRGVPASGNTSAWINVTCSKPASPTVCSIKGWIDLQGTGYESGALVSAYIAATDTFVKSSPTNRSGYYEILGLPPDTYDIGAHKAGYEDAWLNASTITAGGVLWCNLTLLSPFPPTIVHTPLTSLLRYHQYQIFADVTDDRKVDTVRLYYKAVGAGSYTALPMTRLGVSSTYVATLPAQSQCGRLYYYIWANDTLNNVALNPSSGNYSVLVYEPNPPKIENLTALPNPAESGDYVTVTADIFDDWQLASVRINYTRPDGSHGNWSMAKGAGNEYYDWNYFYSTGTYNYTIWARDTFNNTNHTSGSFVVQDTKTPWSVVDPIVPYWNDTSPMTVWAWADDNGTEVATVRLWYRYSPDNATWTLWTSAGISTLYYYRWNFTFPPGQGYYQFISQATDFEGNVENMHTNPDAICGYDTEAPTTNAVALASYWRANSPAYVLLNGSDNLCGFGDTQLWYSFSTDNATWGAWKQFPDGNGTTVTNWSFNFPDGNGHYMFYTIGVDKLGHAEAPPSTADAAYAYDNGTPQITSFSAAPSPCELGLSINFTARFSDLSGIAGAWLDVRLNGGAGSNVSMSLSGTTYWRSYAPSAIGNVTATLWTRDLLGHTNKSTTWVLVRDISGPSIAGLTISPNQGEVPAQVNVSATVTDPGGILNCWLEVTTPSRAVTNLTMDRAGSLFYRNATYSLLGSYNFTIWAMDNNGNGKKASGVVKTVDTVKPVAQAGMVQPVLSGSTVTLDGSGSTDNYGIADHSWAFNDNGAKKLGGVTAVYNFTNPGNFEITLTVKDYGGNVDSSKTWVNVTPRLVVGSVVGYVLDKDGSPIDGARVYIEGTTNEAVTNQDGRFVLSNVSTGSHNIVVSANGFKRATFPVNVTAGGTTNAGELRLQRTDNGAGGLILLILIAVIIAIIAYVLWKRKAKRDGTVIDEIFLMYNDGRLIKHFTRRLKPDMDSDILSSMLVAVQDFVKDSFKGEEGGLDEMKFGRFQVLLGRGEYVIIAALMMGEELAPFKPQIMKCIKEMETKHAALLKDWSGEIDNLKPLQREIQNLIEGKYA